MTLSCLKVRISIMTECLNCKKPTVKNYHTEGKFCNHTCQGIWRKAESDRKVESGLATDARMIKRYLINKYGDRCQSPKCAWDYSQLHIPSELEHIDGNSSNNRLDNLMLICPNCHSLTSTYKSKNKGKGRHVRMIRYREGKSF